MTAIYIHIQKMGSTGAVHVYFSEYGPLVVREIVNVLKKEA